VREAVVTGARDLTMMGMPRKRHIELTLPTSMSYETGDYLAILPMNPRETIGRVFRRFKLPWDAVVTIKGNSTMLLPVETPTPASDVLSSYVELSQPATRRSVLILAAHASSQLVKSELESLAADDKLHNEIIHKRISVLDLLERYPTVELPIGSFLGMLPPMRIRQ
jgi:cytochrome P450/NADPH-cytochrome P450 reductase